MAQLLAYVVLTAIFGAWCAFCGALAADANSPGPLIVTAAISVGVVLFMCARTLLGGF